MHYSKTSQMTTSKVTNLSKWRLAFRELDLAKRPKWPKDLANDNYNSNLKMMIFYKWPVPKLVIFEVLLYRDWWTKKWIDGQGSWNIYFDLKIVFSKLRKCLRTTYVFNLFSSLWPRCMPTILSLRQKMTHTNNFHGTEVTN